VECGDEPLVFGAERISYGFRIFLMNNSSVILFQAVVVPVFPENANKKLL